MTVTVQDLPTILANHDKWFRNDDEGVRADLSGAYLCGADLRSADLRYSDLRGADLCGADLGAADLRGADLRGAYLRGADLRGADLRYSDLRYSDLRGADLRGADLRYTYLRGAGLGGAKLRGADLWGADLRGADLRGADLRGAYLRGADLRGADLRGAIGIAPEICTPLLMLLDQPGVIHSYKLVNADGEEPFNGSSVRYVIGKSVEVSDADTDPSGQYGDGINVATLDWCLQKWMPGYRILVVSFVAADIAAIPTGTDGNFRLHRCLVVSEKHIDPVALGLAGAADGVAR